jgi:hypothetical protein
LVSPQLRIPELKPHADIRALPLSAVEGYVLSRIDGRCSVTEIAALTGLGADMVLGIVEKLRGFGVIHYQDEAPPKPPRPRENPFDRSERVDSRTHPRVEPTSDRPTREHVATGPRTGSRSGLPPRGRSAPPARRLMSESGVSSPPPDMRGPRTDGPRTGTFSSPPTSGNARTLAASSTSANMARDARARAESVQPEDPRSPPKAFVSEERVRQPSPKKAKVQPANDVRAPRAPAPPPQLYDPRELDEEVDLPLERRKQLLELYYRLEQLDYYEALGVDYTADKKDIRAAYFALSKVFHPDSMFRKNLGSFKPKMEATFKYLTEAYETLSKKKNREEYDAYLRATSAAKIAEQALRRQAERDAQPPPAPEPPPPEPSTPPVQFTPAPEPPKVPTPREVTDEDRRLAREVVARRLRGVTQGLRPPVTTPAPTRSVPPPEPPPQELGPRTDPQELLRRLARTLKDVGQVTGSQDTLGRVVRSAQAAFSRGELEEAAQLMGKALHQAPDREDLKLEYARISKALAEKLASNYAEQAKFETKAGKWASAALSWSKVCEGRPDDAAAHRHAAFALFKAGGDLRGAQKYAQEAVFLAPEEIEGRILLTQIYMTIGLKLNAKRELEAATKLDPENEIVKNLQADLKKAEQKA